MSIRAELVLVYWLTTVLSNWNNIVDCKAIGEAYRSTGVVSVYFIKHDKWHTAEFSTSNLLNVRAIY